MLLPRLQRLTPAVFAATVWAAGCASAASRGAAAPDDTLQRTRTPVQVVTNNGVQRTDVFNETAARTREFSVDPERVWAVLPDAYEALKLRATTRRDSDRVYGAENVRLRSEFNRQRLSRYFSCGTGLAGGDAADTYEVSADVVSVVVKPTGSTGGLSVLRTTVSATAQPIQVSGSPVQCASTGRLEERIAELVAARLTS